MRYLNKNDVEGKDTIRVAIVALLIALNFGILNYVGDKKFNTINFESILKVSAGVFVGLTLLIFLLYIIALGISKSYKTSKIKEAHPFLYDLGLALTALIVFMTVVVSIGIKISPYLNNNIIFIYFYFGVGVAGGGKIFTKLFEKHLNQIISITRKKIKLNKTDKRFYIGLILTILSIALAFYLSTESTKTAIELAEKSINKTVLMASPVILQVNDTINESEGRWYISINNTHPIKETGRVYLYKLELNPDKPSMALDHNLKPGESDIFSLTIKSEERDIHFDENLEPFGSAWNIPAAKAYYVNEHVSISVKITCDNCPAQGIILRIPDFNQIPMQVSMSRKGMHSISINTYNWLDYKLEDIIID